MRCDCHIHMVLDGEDWKAALARHKDGPEEAFVTAVLRRYRDGGYTYLRDGGDRWGVGRRARALAPEFGICYRTPLAPISRRGHYGGFIGLQYENLREYAALVARARAEGADFIKLMLSGLMDFNRFGVLTEEGLPAGEIRQLVHIAREEGFAVMAHVNGAVTMLAAAEAGVDSIEHGAYPDAQTLAAMQERRVVWVPTVSTIGNLQGRRRFEEGAVERIYAAAGENLRQFAAMGGLIAVGSDAGAWAVPHGCDTEETRLRQILGAGAAELLDRGNRRIRERF